VQIDWEYGRYLLTDLNAVRCYIKLLVELAPKLSLILQTPAQKVLTLHTHTVQLFYCSMNLLNIYSNILHKVSGYKILNIYCKLSGIYRVSQEECEILRESVPYVKLYRYNPKHLYSKLNGYGDNGQRSLKL